MIIFNIIMKFIIQTLIIKIWLFFHNLHHKYQQQQQYKHTPTFKHTKTSIQQHLPLKEACCHEGNKTAQAIFLNNDNIFTTGFSKHSERQYALWDSVGLMIRL